MQVRYREWDWNVEFSHILLTETLSNIFYEINNKKKENRPYLESYKTSFLHGDSTRI